jgi:NADPH2:quinone reductase
MRALRIVSLDGPEAVELASDVPEPPAEHFLTPGSGVVIEVHAAGVSFPEVLQTRGMYQLKPDLPFVPGAEVAGVVRSAPAETGLAPGDRVCAACVLGGFAEVAVAPAFLTFRLPGALGWAEGAGLVLNYHTAWFALRMRGALREGESVLVHGAAGGVGTAALQVAKASGATAIAVVSSDEKAAVARAAGADEVVRSDAAWREEVVGLTDGGVDVVFDPVGGDRFVDSLRVLREDGRLLVVGFAAGDIPEVRVNRLLLRNTSLVGVFWGGYVMGKPELNREIGARVEELVVSGAVRPVVGARFPLERGADALRLLDERGATGKVLLEVR